MCSWEFEHLVSRFETDVVISGAAALGMFVTALVMVMTPGPNMMYLLSRSISQGYAAGLISLVGTALGFVVYLVLANTGLAIVFVAVPWLYIGLKLAGALYLGYLAFMALRPGGVGLFETRTLTKDSRWSLFRMGLVTNLLNPKAAIMYLALIPQFVRPHAGHVVAQGLILGGIQIAVSAAVNAVLILTAARVARALSQRPSWAAVQRRITGTVLGAIAVLLLREAPQRARL